MASSYFWALTAVLIAFKAALVPDMSQRGHCCVRGSMEGKMAIVFDGILCETIRC